MRELLFRGQTRRPGEKVRIGSGKPLPGNWVYGGIFHQSDRNGSFSIIYTYDPIEKHTVYADTVGQYTGLTDKKGKKIFEGDIVKFSKNTYQISFESGSFILLDRQGEMISKIGGVNDHCYSLFDLSLECCWEDDWAVDIEVIGNIHDTPELLTGGKTDV